MPGLVPGIHVFGDACKKDVDGRDEPGHDEFNVDTGCWWPNTAFHSPHVNRGVAIA